MNEAVSFEVITDLSAINPTKIESNFPEVKAWLTNVLQPYATMVVSEDAIAGAKSDRAAIRKIADSISQQRKTVKEQWNAPLLEYEAQCKELEAMCKEAAGSIDVQIKDIEQALKDEKFAKIKAAFDEASKEISAYIKWEHVFNPRWGNKGYDIEEAISDAVTACEAVQGDIDTIRSLESENETSLLLYYADCHDLRKTLQRDKALKDLAEAEKRAKERSVNSAFAQEEKPAEAAEVPTEAYIQPSPISPIADEKPVQPTYYTLRFACELTSEQAKKLKAFFTENGIKYKKI